MEVPCRWKISPDPAEVRSEPVPFLSSRKFFAVDDSGSTGGAILRQEKAFVDELRNKRANADDTIAQWGSTCDNPTKDFGSLSWRSSHMGTHPATILENTGVQEKLKVSDVWFLLTDGEIYDGHVHELAELAHARGILNVPVVFLITGSRGRSPDTTNISVGISFFAGSQDTLIMFKETQTGKLFVIAAKGCFAKLAGTSAAAKDLSSWNDMPTFSNEDAFFEHCETLNVQVAKAESRVDLPKGVNLGPEWEEANNGPAYVDIDELLQAGFLSDGDAVNLMAEDAFSALAVAYKTRRRIPELRSFVRGQKIEQVGPKLEDVSGAAAVISRMSASDVTADERQALQEKLREAHARNREHYQQAVANYAGSEKEQMARKRNQLVDAALRSLASIEAASFTADILSRRSNRARRAGAVTSNSSIDMANLDFDGPSYKGFCLICCGDEEVMSISLKELASDKIDDNTTDFALNFPIAAGSSPKNANLISSQNVCFQCALLGPSGMSIYKEKIKAIIPAVSYEGSNKKYINDQLYVALTAGLQTGAAGVAQLFMAILSEVLKTKSWAGAGLQESQPPINEQNEALQRRKTFEWMLDQLLKHTRTRETFSEVGEWVAFPKALEWVAQDFETNGLASFFVTYPIAGHANLMSFGKVAGGFSDDLVRRMCVSKAVYRSVVWYLTKLLEHESKPGDWQQAFMELLYQDFNASRVPKYQGRTQTLLTDPATFGQRYKKGSGDCCTPQDETWTRETQELVMRKIQLVLFWLLYQQKAHTTAQNFFTRMSHKEHLASAVFNPALSVPESELYSNLMSIFVDETRRIDVTAVNLHTDICPFKTPFGPSVLHCGYEACGKSFLPEGKEISTAPESVEAIREARRQHLIKVFGIRERFERSQTGLPELTVAGKSPSSTHTNFHMSIARHWAGQTREKRRDIVSDDTVREDFVVSTKQRLCEQGRGNVYDAEIEQDIRDVLPSFFKVLKTALRAQGKEGCGVEEYEHNFEDAGLEGKISFELLAEASGNSEV